MNASFVVIFDIKHHNVILKKKRKSKKTQRENKTETEN